MRRLAVLFTTVAIAAGAITNSASAQSPRAGMRMPCHDATEIAKQLSNKYAEAPVAFGVQSNGNLLQVYATEDKRTWTVVTTTPAGLSCILAAGRGWETLRFFKEDPMA